MMHGRRPSLTIEGALPGQYGPSARNIEATDGRISARYNTARDENND